MARRRTRRPFIKVTVTPPRFGRRGVDPVVLALVVIDVLLAAGLVRSSGSWLPVAVAAAAVAIGLGLVSVVQRRRSPGRW